jgi:hypothetical protein
MVINGILLGSCVSIALSLLLVLIVFLIIGGENPRIAPELVPLTTSMVIFLGMTAISALSFYSVVKDRHWLWLAQAGALLGLVATGWYYWP